jgi:hypothetical protein
MIRPFFSTVAVVLAVLIVSGCGGAPPSPLDEIGKALGDVPTYSVVLDDMKEEGSFSKSYYHKYRVVTEDGSRDTDWLVVSKEDYQRYLPFLGMTVYAKKDGKVSETAGPPGYEYVGDPRYGKWQSDSSGRSFWVFYGQYRLLSDLLSPRPIYRNDYRTYTGYRSQGRPYYGPNKEYGTSGSYTKQKKPNFYSRRMSREATKKASFSNRVNKRVGRTRSSYRGRGGRAGK